MKESTTDRRGNWWLPYFGMAIVVGGWLINIGMDRANHKHLEDKVSELERQFAHLQEEQRVDNVINYSEHPRWTASVLSAEVAK